MDELRAAGAEEQQLSLGNHGGRLLAVLKNMTNLLAHIRSTWLACDKDLVTVSPEVSHQTVDMGGLSATFAPLKSDECTFFGHFYMDFSG